MVVLRDEEHIPVEAVDERAPGAGVVVPVLLEVRVAGLVEIAEAVVREVDEFVLGSSVRTGGLQCPGGDLVATASGPGAAEDERDAKRHGLPSGGGGVDVSTLGREKLK